jgi:integrase/recombinase XerC
VSSTHATPPTLKRATEVYLADIHAHRSPQISQAYSQALHLFQQVLKQKLDIEAAKTPSGQLSAQWAKEFLSYLQEHRAVETEHLYSRAILDFYTYAEARQWTTTNADQIEEHLTRSRRPKKHNIPCLPRDEIEQILAYARSAPIAGKGDASYRERLRARRDKAFILTLAETGMRVSEICDLRRYQANLDQKLLVMEPGISFSLSNPTNAAIRNYLGERNRLDQAQALFSPEHLPLFARHDKRAGKRVLAISRWTGANIVEQWVELALPSETRQRLEAEGQRITPQSFRHYFVFTTLEHTEDITEAQALARHTDPSTTKRYLRSLEEQVADPGTGSNTPLTLPNNPEAE